MERKRPAMKWVRSAYVIYGILFAGFIGGLAEVIAISDEINHSLVRLLESDPQGPMLDGRYLYPRNWLILFIFCFALMLIFPATTLLRMAIERRREDAGERQTGPEVLGLRQDLDDAMRFANNITAYMYPSEENQVPRLNVIEIAAKYMIEENGDTASEICLDLECVTAPAHFYIYYIRADEESGEIKFLRQLNFEAFDLDGDHKLDWLPIRNEATTKALAIFFPEVQPGTRKRLRLTYRWPRYMGKLIDLGATDFDWYYISQNPDTPARVKVEWVFDSSFAPLDCRISRRPAETASIRRENNKLTFSWIYEDPEALLKSRCAVEFFKPGS